MALFIQDNEGTIRLESNIEDLKELRCYRDIDVVNIIQARLGYPFTMEEVPPAQRKAITELKSILSKITEKINILSNKKESIQQEKNNYGKQIINEIKDLQNTISIYQEKLKKKVDHFIQFKFFFTSIKLLSISFLTYFVMVYLFIKYQLQSSSILLNTLFVLGWLLVIFFILPVIFFSILSLDEKKFYAIYNILLKPLVYIIIKNKDVLYAILKILLALIIIGVIIYLEVKLEIVTSAKEKALELISDIKKEKIFIIIILKFMSLFFLFILYILPLIIVPIIASTYMIKFIFQVKKDYKQEKQQKSKMIEILQSLKDQLENKIYIKQQEDNKKETIFSEKEKEYEKMYQQYSKEIKPLVKQFNNMLEVVARDVEKALTLATKAKVNFDLMRQQLNKTGLIIAKLLCPYCGSPIKIPKDGNTITCQRCNNDIYVAIKND